MALGDDDMKMKEAVPPMMVVSALIALMAITAAAGFTGIMEKKEGAAIQAFLVADTIAFACSLSATVACIAASGALWFVVSSRTLNKVCYIAGYLLVAALVAAVIAFVTAVYSAVSARATAVAVVVLGLSIYFPLTFFIIICIIRMF
ncbi:hypothetical protein DM860_014227 [Cuscuta australis]|uniref:PGG domain-containing protein n=1 Tax=Cuscuta australis TaxID=267555 RepID=A0A328DE55_9ASTE|nr:hypothetical protein DM860_014227 [Cuscuta australis]